MEDLDSFGAIGNSEKGKIMSKFYRYGVFWHKTQFLTKNKTQQSFSLFLGVIATLASTFAKKSIYPVLTSSSKVRVQVFERKPSADDHAIDLA